MRFAPSVGAITSTPLTWSRSFPAAAAQAREARRFLAAVLDGAPAADAAAACLSELVNNAIEHSSSGRTGGTFTVTVQLGEGRLRVEVRDQGGPWKAACAENGEHGRGLLIVSHTAREWGRGGGSQNGWTVWFALDWS
jgi:anti-sigma regulatory factor (Ser/Thr protein kinase)